MSKYYKAEDIIRAIEGMENGYNGWSDTYDKAQIIGVIEELPTIEVSEEVLKATKKFHCYTIADENAEMGMRTKIEPIIEASEDCISRAEMLDTYAELYDVFDDYPNIIEELHKVYDKLNGLSNAISRAEGEWKITNTYKDHNGRVVDRVEHTDCGFIWHREMGEPLQKVI